MILIKIELISAVSASRSRELGRMYISNDGTLLSAERGNYEVRLMRKGTTDVVQKATRVEDYPKKSAVIWSLVARALKNLGIR